MLGPVRLKPSGLGAGRVYRNAVARRGATEVGAECHVGLEAVVFTGAGGVPALDETEERGEAQPM